jgi:hypothetical protein
VNFEKIFFALIILLIIAGVFFRIYGLDSQIMQYADESRVIVGSIKVLYEDFYEGQFWIHLHPPIDYWSFALPTLLINQDFPQIKSLSLNEFNYLHVPFKEYQKILPLERYVVFIYGLIAFLGIFLLSRHLFGLKKALLSTAFFSLSFDIIGLGRLLFFEIPAIAFIFISIFLLIKFLESNTLNMRLFYYAGFLLSFLVAIGSRIQAVLLLPLALILIIREKKHGIVTSIRLPKKKEKKLINQPKMLTLIGYLLLLIFVTMIFYNNIYSPAAVERYEMESGASSFSQTFAAFSLPSVVLATLLRDNYLYFFGILGLIVYVGIKIKNGIDPQTILNNKGLTAIILFICLNFITFSVIKQTSSFSPRYTVFLAAPLFIFFGHAILELEKKIEEKIKTGNALKIVFLLLAAFTIIEAMTITPLFSGYTKTGLDPVHDYSKNYNSTLEALKFLEEQKNPLLLSNDPTLMIAYKGNESFAVTQDYNPECNPETYKKLANNGILIVTQLNFDPLSRECRHYKNLLLEKIKTIGTNEAYRIIGTKN